MRTLSRRSLASAVLLPALAGCGEGTDPVRVRMSDASDEKGIPVVDIK